MKLRLAIWADIRCAIQSAIQFPMLTAMLRAMRFAMLGTVPEKLFGELLEG